MTREEKLEWLATATNEQVVNQLRWVIAMNDEDGYKLVTAEILKRLNRDVNN